MQESNPPNNKQQKIHSQFFRGEGAGKKDESKNTTKESKLKAGGWGETSNLCGALEFAEKLTKTGSQPKNGKKIKLRINEKTGPNP
jgi:DNA polymerase III, alpha subunit